MTRLEHLLTIVAEECAEVAQRASKANRFGLDEIQDDDYANSDRLTNYERLHREFCDLVAVLTMINYDLVRVTPEDTDAKQAKVEKYLQYAFAIGTLREE